MNLLTPQASNRKTVSRRPRLLYALLSTLYALLCCIPAHAHVGNKDVYQTVTAGPYKLFVTIRPPTVIPGIATVEVRSTGAAISGLTITPLPLTGEGAKHPPTPDAMTASTADPSFYTGSLWIMGCCSWQVRFNIAGAGGNTTTSVPLPAYSTKILPMQRSLGMILAALGLVLVVGFVGIVAAATREARLAPGIAPDAPRRRRALVAAAAGLVVAATAVYFGGKWWNVEAADYRSEMHRNSELRPTLAGNTLSVLLGDPDPKADGGWKVIRNNDLLPDHNHLMHLYAIRWPEMDAAFHLHPAPTGNKGLAETLPAMPPGTYKLYADVVFARSGFPETETATLTIPANFPNALTEKPGALTDEPGTLTEKPGALAHEPGAPGPDSRTRVSTAASSLNPGATQVPGLAPEDAAAFPAPLSAGELGPSYKLPDGYTMTWDKPAALTANTAYGFTFHLLDPQGKPASDMQPYLGMAGHAAFVKTDGTAFAHTHPEGSAAMPSVMLAEASTAAALRTDPAMTMPSEPPSPTVTFPYGFPSPGRYRIFIQMKHGSTVETGVFDADVQ